MKPMKITRGSKDDKAFINTEHLQLIEEAHKGLDDVAAGRIMDAKSTLQARKQAQTSTPR